MYQSAALITNAVVGHGRAERIARQVEAVARKHGIVTRLVVTTSVEQTRATAAEAATHADLIIAVGGDGTIHHVVAGILASGVPCPLLPIPAGTGNDTVRSLGLPHRWRNTVALLERGVPRRVDLLSVQWPDGRAETAINVLSTGFDAEVAAMVRRSRLGPAAYPLSAIRALLRLTYRTFTLTVDGVTSEERCAFVAVANGAFYGGGMQIAPGALVDDGALDLAVAGPIGRLEALRVLPQLYSGRHISHPLFTLRRAASVTVGGDPAPVQVDGEAAPSGPFTVQVLPGALTMLGPSATGQSSSALSRPMAGAAGGPRSSRWQPGQPRARRR